MTRRGRPVNEIFRTIGIAVVVLGAGYFLGLNSGGSGDSGRTGEYDRIIREKDREIDLLHAELVRKTATLQGELEDLRAEVERGAIENRRLGELLEGAAGDSTEIVSEVRGLDGDLRRARELLRELRTAESAAADGD